MKAVILAAGKGVRMLPLTLEKPKPLLEWQGKALIEHMVDTLPPEVDEISIVVGYMEDEMHKFFANKDIGRKITLVSQKEIGGTAPALMLCEDFVGDDKFILMYADDIHDKAKVAELASHDLALLTKIVPDPRALGVVVKDSNGVILDIEEKPANPKSNEGAVGVYILDKRIFRYFDKTRTDKKEYYLTEMIGRLIKEHPVRAVLTNYWKKITTPEDLAD